MPEFLTHSSAFTFIMILISLWGISQFLFEDYNKRCIPLRAWSTMGGTSLLMLFSLLLINEELHFYTMAKLKSDNSRKSKVSTFKPSWHVGGSIIVKLLKDLQRSIALHKCMHMSKHSETIHKKAILKLLLSILNHD